MAAGLTLIFGVMDIINIAQGALVVLGAYMSYVLSVHLGIDLFAGLIITIPAFFVLGVAIEWAFMRRLHERDRTAMSILARRTPSSRRSTPLEALNFGQTPERGGSSRQPAKARKRRSKASKELFTLVRTRPL